MFKKINRSIYNKILVFTTIGVFGLMCILAIMSLIALIKSYNNRKEFDSFLSFYQMNFDNDSVSLQITNITDDNIYYTLDFSLNSHYEEYGNLITRSKSDCELLVFKMNDTYYKINDEIVFLDNITYNIHIEAKIVDAFDGKDYCYLYERVRGISSNYLAFMRVDVKVDESLNDSYNYHQDKNLLTKNNSKKIPVIVLLNVDDGFLNDFISFFNRKYLPFFLLLELILGIGTCVEINITRKKEEQEKIKPQEGEEE